MSTNVAGLEGVVAASTRLSQVDGERGRLVIAGFAVEDLAERATFEETTWLLWHDELPTGTQLAGFERDLAAQRTLPATTLTVLRDCARLGVDGMDALRMAAGTLSLVSDDEVGLVARLPVIVASYARLRRGLEPIAPRGELGHAANFLYMLSGAVPDPERVRGLETYLNTVVDHGLNASTFTARVITSTGSDLVSAVVGAIGALKGPLHGGAPGPALEMVFEIGDLSRAEACLRRKIEAGEKLMGFGHRVYKVRDPRAEVLARAAERMFTRAGDMALYDLARGVERKRSVCSRNTSRGDGCRPTWSSTRRCSCTASVSMWSCSRRRSRSAGPAAGSPTRSSSAARTASSVRSPSTSVRRTAPGSLWPSGPNARPTLAPERRSVHHGRRAA